MKAVTSAFASSISGPIFGKDLVSWSRTSFPGRADRGSVGLGEDRAEHRGDHVAVRLGHVGEQVAGEVDPATLVPGTLKGPLQRLDQTGVLIADHQPHSVQTALLQGGQEAAPERLVLAATSTPRTSREPSEAIRVATTTAIETTWEVWLRTLR